PGVHNGPATAEAAACAAAAGATDCLVAGEGAVADVHDAGGAVHSAARAGAAYLARGARTAHGPVVLEHAELDGQRAAVMEDAASGARHHARDPAGLILGHHDVRKGQVAARVPDTAATVGPAVGDRQVVDGHGHARADPEHPAGVVAADRQTIRPRTVAGQGGGNGQLAAGPGD